MKSGDDGSTARAIARPASVAYCARAQLPFARLVRRQLDPRREPRDQPTDRFEMRHRAAIRCALLDWHPCLQRPVRKIRQHRIRELPHHRDPVLAIVDLTSLVRSVRL
jgi:hypothetical protein